MPGMGEEAISTGKIIIDDEHQYLAASDEPAAQVLSAAGVDEAILALLRGRGEPCIRAR